MSIQAEITFGATPRLVDHGHWPQVLPFVVVEDCSHEDGSRFRLELKSLTPGLASIALAMTVRCVACGADIHPIRSRKAPKNKRSETVGHGLYVAVACPLAQSIGCSRGRCASDEYQRLRRLVEEFQFVGVVA